MTRKIGSRYTVTRVIGRGTCGTVWEGAGPDGGSKNLTRMDSGRGEPEAVAVFGEAESVLGDEAVLPGLGVEDVVARVVQQRGGWGA